tara:strand:+ start:735 stop:1841 length:1107 start_codon:yes stop_codon:yes gene_type:complete
MTDFEVDTVIIGAGVVGLAIAKEISLQGKNVLILEAEDNFGKLTSSRNSGVIHSGIYYSTNSLKSKFCVLGNKLLYEYAEKNFIPFKNTKKILVASSKDQLDIIDKIKKQAEINGVEKINNITKEDVSKLEPLIKCEEALLVSSSGIIDVISFMRSLVGKIEDLGGMISYNSKITKVNINDKNFTLLIDDKDQTQIKCKELINSAGLYASNISMKIEELDKKFVPKTFFAKGNYFSSSKNYGIKHLVYPIPEGFGLGIHLTLELDESIKFGPDVEWVEDIKNYQVNENRKKHFEQEIHKYFPSFDTDLLKPSYSGIRPIMNKKDKSMRDFIIQTAEEHSIPNLINLYGIESPGLTSSLALAKHVAKLF